ncbi:MAG: type I-E CRISPR-associated protein Cse1/CasA [candidate division Zixibacteria bacterium]|nr:type I-E CRISPR-associated protein Cse1/CasA [candidate division Zixibacteria bacterium]
MKASFNLLTERWIPCITEQGKYEEYSIRDVLHKARQIREVHSQSPLVTISIYRLLLAILHRVLGPPSEEAWGEIYESGEWDLDAIDSYLDQWEDRFDLFSEEYPFYQVRDFPKKKETSISKITLEFASGNSDTLFDHNYSSNDLYLTSSQAACYLLSSQISGLTGNSASIYREFGIIFVGMLIILHGDSFWEILTKNLVPYNGKDRPFEINPEDSPIWENDNNNFTFNKKPPQKYSIGYLEYLTYQHRYIQLFPESSQGDTIVKKVGVAQGLKMPENWLYDQFKIFNFPDKGKPSALKMSKNKALWRDYDALLGNKGGYKLPEVIRKFREMVLENDIEKTNSDDLEVFGISNYQANVFMWRHERLPLPFALLDNKTALGNLSICLSDAENIAKSLNTTIYILNSELGANRKDDHPPIDKNSIEQAYWNYLEPKFFEILDILPADGEKAKEIWLKNTEEAAKKAFEEGVKSLRFTARALKAITLARKKLNIELWKLHKEEDGIE